MNLEKYNKIFCDLFDVKETDLNEDFRFGQANGWDSLAHMELIANLEDSFSIMFDAEDILNFGNYEHGKKILEKYGVEF